MYISTTGIFSSFTPPQVYITQKHNRYKQYSNNIYLAKDSNFEIEIYNPNLHKISAKISYEGKLMSQNSLVILPGQRIFLDRFIDTDNKLIFKTYEISAQDPNAESILNNNGLLVIDFFQEILYTQYYPQQNTLQYNGNLNSGTPYIPDYTNTTAWNTISCKNNSSLSSNIETGYIAQDVVKSDTKFQSEYSLFNKETYHSVSFKLWPETQVEFNQIKRYCPNCGIRIRNNNWKFCPSCGTNFNS